jgi:hypothetical protein
MKKQHHYDSDDNVTLPSPNNSDPENEEEYTSRKSVETRKDFVKQITKELKLKENREQYANWSYRAKDTAVAVAIIIGHEKTIDYLAEVLQTVVFIYKDHNDSGKSDVAKFFFRGYTIHSNDIFLWMERNGMEILGKKKRKSSDEPDKKKKDKKFRSSIRFPPKSNVEGVATEKEAPAIISLAELNTVRKVRDKLGHFNNFSFEVKEKALPLIIELSSVLDDGAISFLTNLKWTGDERQMESYHACQYLISNWDSFKDALNFEAPFEFNDKDNSGIVIELCTQLAEHVAFPTVIFPFIAQLVGMEVDMNSFNTSYYAVTFFAHLNRAGKHPNPLELKSRLIPIYNILDGDVEMFCARKLKHVTPRDDVELYTFEGMFYPNVEW